ncbi:HEPN domain-containing protein [Spirosoma sp. SC4-14]|uniref:HEPN domain-containing protein n=1 Tax=Spirosoma sp. SC4-14 TaxID=3128900 RepID=UPI0030CDA129
MLLLSVQDWNSAVNQLYYADFYAVLALMAKEGHKVSSHSGAKHLLNVHFTRTGRLAIEHNSTFGRLFNARQKGDYDDFEMFSESDALILLEQTPEFIREIKNLI